MRRLVKTLRADDAALQVIRWREGLQRCVCQGASPVVDRPDSNLACLQPVGKRQEQPACSRIVQPAVCALVGSATPVTAAAQLRSE